MILDSPQSCPRKRTPDCSNRGSATDVHTGTFSLEPSTCSCLASENSLEAL
jgi:hypothetical protein